jgi:hypothetical protein
VPTLLRFAATDFSYSLEDREPPTFTLLMLDVMGSGHVGVEPWLS